VSTNDGGPAFPVPAQTDNGWAEPECRTPIPYHGMTLRDYFAAKALGGILASWPEDGTSLSNEYAPEKCASTAYRYADAMLAERARGGK
jgi:hypothetical protein